MKNIILNEATRNALLNKSKSSNNGGKQRFKRRLKSRILNSTSQINNLDMDKLFKKGILTVSLNVQGETDRYEVKVTVGDFINNIQNRLKSQNFDIRTITQSLMESMNSENVYIWCSCRDFFYRYSYWATRNDYTSGPAQPSNGKWIRNPYDDKGSCCKHLLLVLSNLMWLQIVARTIFNYVKYMETHYESMYQRLIYPKLYGQKFKADTVDRQTTLWDRKRKLPSDDIKNINKEQGKSTQFKQGNKQGVRFAKDEEPVEDENQLTLDL